ncbi:MAG: hypothetical protein IT211_02120 [Armatimonadetes bacterium]|nr:hypothetical protein [Armatimonadota bacterium]
MLLCLFEDQHVGNLYPLSLTHHPAQLLVGTKPLCQRVGAIPNMAAITWMGREPIERVLQSHGHAIHQPESTTDTLYLNARLRWHSNLLNHLPLNSQPDSQPGGWILTDGTHLLAARASAIPAHLLVSSTPDQWEGLGLTIIKTDTLKLYSYLWELVEDNARMLMEDAAGLASSTLPDMAGAHVVNPANIIVGEGCSIQPGVVLDASGGAIVFGNNVKVMANAVVVGPCFIGDNSTIKIGAKIYEKTSIGSWCKIGGEVEGSIILGFSNKQHDGFLGHSYLGEWVNLGADTNTSDLKNNYGQVRVTFPWGGVNSGTMFLGSLIGDHSKTGINTMLNTGTVIGVGANIFGGGFPPKFISSFAWGGSGGSEEYDRNKAIQTARTVMLRRNVAMTDAEEELLRGIEYHSSAE